MTRSEHLAWCKKRALEILAGGDRPGAWISFMSDMSKHQETADHAALELGSMMLMSGNLNTDAVMQKFIEDFN